MWKLEQHSSLRCILPDKQPTVAHGFRESSCLTFLKKDGGVSGMEGGREEGKENPASPNVGSSRTSGWGEAVGWAAKSLLPQGRGGASGERLMASQGEDTGIGKGAQGEENLGGDR